MKLGVLYKIVHGLANFPSIPISVRDNHFDLRSLNPQKTVTICWLQRWTEVLLFPRFCETLE